MCQCQDNFPKLLNFSRANLDADKSEDIYIYMCVCVCEELQVFLRGNIRFARFGITCQWRGLSKDRQVP